MKRLLIVTLFPFFLHGLAFPASAQDSVSDPFTLDRFIDPILRSDLKILGAQSCASASCHGGPRPGMKQLTARRGAAYPIWIENDPHAQSWRTMCSSKSTDMMGRLNIIDAKGNVIDEAALDNCLACHNSTKRFSETRINPVPPASSPPCVCQSTPLASAPCKPDTDVYSASAVNGFVREGVGCSGCHGPSERWIGRHTQYDFDPLNATDLGFVAAGDLYSRARMCASCHVGDQDRDMNHDIIAAGHPPLRYELVTFHARQPKHWRDEEAADEGFYEAQLWLAGQVAATDAALSLLHSRAISRNSVSQWPELSAYDCASCHHTLGLDNARRSVGEDRAGVASYSRWNDAGLRWVIQSRIESGEAEEVDHELLTWLQRVRSMMESSAAPDASVAARAIEATRQTLARWFDSAAGSTERTGMRSQRLARVVVSAAGKADTFETWESAAQFYLAAVAARSAWPRDGDARSAANQLRYGLRYGDKLDVSDYAKKDSGPTLARHDARRLGIELAGWLGEVDVEADDWDDVDSAGQEYDEQLRLLVEQIEARWKKANRDRPVQTTPDEKPADETKPKVQSKEALREKLDELLKEPNGDE